MSYTKIDGDDYVNNNEAAVELYPRLPERKHDEASAPPQDEETPTPSAPPQTDEDQYMSSSSYSQVHLSQPVSYSDGDMGGAPVPSAPLNIPMAIPVQGPSNPIPQAGLPSMAHQTPIQLIPVTPPAPNESELCDRIMLRQSEFQMSRYIHEAWMFLKPNFCIFILAQVVTGLVFVAYMMINAVILSKIFPHPDGEERVNQHVGYEPMFGLLAWVISSVLFSSLLGMQVLCSWYIAVFNAMRTNSHVMFRDFFSAFSCQYYFRIAALGAVLSTLHIALSFLYFFPALWFSMITLFSVALHQQHNFLSIWKSIRFSARVVHRHFCSVLGFLVCLVLLQIVGFFCFLVGLLITIPLAHISLCYAYHYLIGVNGVTIYVPQAMQQVATRQV